MKDVYQKLVRDKIPEIIAAQGDIPTIRPLNNKEFFQALNVKLQEEVAEYLNGFSTEELADIVEVIYAILACKEISPDAFEQIRQKKYEERGGFQQKTYLLDVRRK